MRTAHASGIGLRELARNMGIPAGTVLARAKREGWTRSVRDAKALAVRPVAPVVSVATAAAITRHERGQRHVERVAGIVERTLPSLEQMEPNALLDRVEDFDRLDKIGRRAFVARRRSAPGRSDRQHCPRGDVAAALTRKFASALGLLASGETCRLRAGRSLAM